MIGGRGIVQRRVVANVRSAITARENASCASKPTYMERNVNINVVLDVLIRHVTLHLESVILVRIVILGHFVIVFAVIPAITVSVAGMATASQAVQTTTSVQSASSVALKTARLPYSASGVTNKESVCTDVRTALQVTTVRQVRESWHFFCIN